MQKKERGVIDRFEGDSAIIVLENKDTVTVPLSSVENAHEGDCVMICSSGNRIAVTIDKTETEKKSESIRSRFDRLKK